MIQPKFEVSKTYLPGVEEIKRQLEQAVADHFDAAARELAALREVTPKVIRDRMILADQEVAGIRRQIYEIETFGLVSLTMTISGLSEEAVAALRADVQGVER